MYRHSLHRWWAGCGWLLLLGLLSGCGPKAGDVTGRVLFKGTPLPAGRITFLCEGGNKPVVTRDIRDGAYTMQGLPLGQARVTVVTIPPAPSSPAGPIQSPVPTDVPSAPAGPYVEIPDRYRMPDTSGLTYTVTAGSQTKNWELSP